MSRICNQKVADAKLLGELPCARHQPGEHKRRPLKCHGMQIEQEIRITQKGQQFPATTGFTISRGPRQHVGSP